VSVARDLAQSAVIEDRADPDWARLIAEADHALLSGHAQRAFTLLTRVID
jgi:beta-glucosidase